MLNFTRYYLILGGAKVRFFSYIPKNDEIIFVDFTSFNILIPFHSPLPPFSQRPSVHFPFIPFNTIFRRKSR